MHEKSLCLMWRFEKSKIHVCFLILLLVIIHVLYYICIVSNWQVGVGVENVLCLEWDTQAGPVQRVIYAFSLWLAGSTLSDVSSVWVLRNAVVWVMHRPTQQCSAHQITGFNSGIFLRTVLSISESGYRYGQCCDYLHHPIMHHSKVKLLMWFRLYGCCSLLLTKWKQDLVWFLNEMKHPCERGNKRWG